MTLAWTQCDFCGGSLPLVDGDNDHPILPEAVECDGFASSGLCRAYRCHARDELEDRILRDIRE